MAESIKLTLGLALTSRTRALFDGTVRPEGIELRCESQFGNGLDNTGARHRAILGGIIDGGECSTSSLILARMRGSSLRGLPIFPARQFRHRCIFCPVTSALSQPSELKGKRVVAHRYNATTAVWLRGLLQDEYGASPEQMEWYVAEPDVGEEATSPPPKSVTVNFIPSPRTRENAIELVEERRHRRGSGALWFSGKKPQIAPFAERSPPGGGRLLSSNAGDSGYPYSGPSGSIGCEAAVDRKQPAVGFPESAQLGRKVYERRERDEARWLSDAIGYDPYGYGFDVSTRKSIEALIRYQLRQGLLEREPALEELFFRETASA